MSTLTEEHIYLVQQYREMLDSIEEGFQYVIASFQDYSKTEGDLVLSDIFSAFLQIAQVNQDISIIYQKDSSMISAITAYEDVLLAAEKMDGLFEKSQEKTEIVQQFLYPAYKQWYHTINPLLIAHVQQ
ncbi:hypothetical protein [Psychrobacillus sp. OK032]|uniref:hypothetical protein n=1 Tax=Psychrobacillus sp. OK032 TaxID=1884358 RepID=UPI0008CA9B07|nr:hypothetical protein [Psychrobacillus sp. OK032]SER65117.1 hypothetical protein SAMN05518872_101491 [Psychrobacillus sp. OK032]